MIPFLFLSFRETETKLPRAESLINKESRTDHAHNRQALKHGEHIDYFLFNGGFPSCQVDLFFSVPEF